MSQNHNIRRGKILSFIELMRPANIITAFADILAGYAAVGGVLIFDGMLPDLSPDPLGLGLLLLATFGLYGGGVVFNDLFDAELDAEERPERPIPSGRVSRTGAFILGSLLLLAGAFFAFQAHYISGILALGIALFALVYDKWAKHSALWGPLFMGSCRGGNLLLGASILPALLPQVWFIGLIPVAYIGAITLVSQGEVHGGSRRTGFAALGLIASVVLALALLSVLPGYSLLAALPFLLLLGGMVLPPFFKAARTPDPEKIRSAIKKGVLSLIILNSTIAAGFAGIGFGILVLILLPVSLLFSRLFAVT